MHVCIIINTVVRVHMQDTFITSVLEPPVAKSNVSTLATMKTVNNKQQKMAYLPVAVWVILDLGGDWHSTDKWRLPVGGRAGQSSRHARSCR